MVYFPTFNFVFHIGKNTVNVGKYIYHIWIYMDGKLWEHFVGEIKLNPNCAGGPCVSRCMSCRRRVFFVFFWKASVLLSFCSTTTFGMIFAGFPSFFVFKYCYKLHPQKGLGQLAIPTCNGDAKDLNDQ